MSGLWPGLPVGEASPAWQASSLWLEKNRCQTTKNQNNMLWLQTKAHLKFLYRSFHLHGVHSPFVFHLSNACFSKKEVLPRLVNYLKIETILLFGKPAEKEIFKTPKTALVNPPETQQLNLFLKKGQKFDLIYFPSQTKNLFALFQKTLPMAHNDSIFVFEKIHRSKEMEHIWERILKTEKVRVSIDTFQYGFVFFRKEQAKEDFSIRLR